jgi:hypothetical protein
MRVRDFSLICLLICLVIAAPAVAQQQRGAAADPLTGTWAGDWGPNASDRNQVTVDLKWDGKALTGVVKTANRQETTLQKSTFDPATGTVRMMTTATARGGATVTYTIEGKLANNVMTGSWNHDAVKGDFRITRK